MTRMMKCPFLPLLLCTVCAAAGDFAGDFHKLRKAGDHDAMAKLLEKAADTERDNPDYYALASNYWWNLSDATPVISTKPAANGGLSIRDQETGEEVGSIALGGEPDPALRKKALDLTAEGFRRFPRRLDIGLGLAQVQFQTGDMKGAVATLRDILKIASAPDAELKWTAGADLPGPAATFVPESVHGYTAPLFRRETPETDALCRELLDATVAAFPDHPFAYNLLAVLADAKGEKDESYRWLQTAAAKAPEDALILLNLADAQRARGKTDEARATYAKIVGLKPGDEIEAQAKEGIEALEGGEER